MYLLQAVADSTVAAPGTSNSLLMAIIALAGGIGAVAGWFTTRRKKGK